MSLRVAVVLLACLVVSCARPRADDAGPQPRPVRVEIARPGPHDPTLLLVGRVVPSEIVPVKALRAGTLRLAPRFASGLRTGAEVAEGEVLATVGNPAVVAEGERAALEAAHARSERDMAARSRAEGFISARELHDVEHALRLAEQAAATARAAVAELTVRAPRAGRLVVDEVVSSGAPVGAGDLLARVAGRGAPRIEAWCSSADRKLLSEGLEASVAAPGTTARATARIAEIAPLVDETGTVRVALDVTDPASLPEPGEGVEVTVSLASREVVTVPDEAVVAGAGGAALYVVRPRPEQGMSGFVARQVFVQAGSRGNGRVEIVSGLADGEKVIVSGVAFLRPGDLVVETTEAEGKR